MENWRKKIRKLKPYTPGEQPNWPDMIKLNTNENPYPPSPMVAEVLRRQDAGMQRLYPDPSIHGLVHELADFYGLQDDQVFVGVGSDDVLAMSFLAFFQGSEPILFPDITYSFYDVWAGIFRIPYRKVSLDPELKLRPEDYKEPNGGIIFPNPNAPTGLALGRDQIREILQSNPDVVVIVDEAYIDFGGESAIPLLKEFDNLLVVQTFSKSRSMAGMRIGFAMGSPELICFLNDVKHSINSYTMNRIAIETGIAAVKDRAYFQECCQKIIDLREISKRRLGELGFVFPDSKANFIFASHQEVRAEKLYQALREKHIFVRYFPEKRIDNYLRITIGTPEQMDTLFRFLENYL